MSVEMPRTVTTVVMMWPRSRCFDRYWQGWKGTLKHEVSRRVLAAMELYIEVWRGAGSDGRSHWSKKLCWQWWKVTLEYGVCQKVLALMESHIEVWSGDGNDGR